MGKFVIKETKNGGFKFDLKAGNGEVIATSEVYSGEAACKKGIESVRKNAVEAKLEDQTVEGFAAVTNPKFEVYADKAGEFRFRLKARNGEIIAVSEGYKAKNSCLNEGLSLFFMFLFAMDLALTIASLTELITKMENYSREFNARMEAGAEDGKAAA